MKRAPLEAEIMDKRIVWIGTLAAIAITPILWTVVQNQEEPLVRGDAPATNVVWILVDSLRHDRLQTYGYNRNPTSPNIEILADQSVVFDNAFVQAPWTKPSVASMMTSLLPRELGMYDWEHTLSPSFLTFAEHLQSQGFHTEAHFSNIALLGPASNLDQGFDVYDGDVLKKGRPKKIKTSREITDAGIAFLEAEQHDRFFLWLHYFDPHKDYLKHRGFRFGKKRNALYDGEIAFTDHHLGRLFNSLKETGRLADTVVVLVSDHGEGLGQHGISHHTKALYDHQLHVPLIVYAPWMTPARRADVVSGIDLAPTLLSMLGVPIPEEFHGAAIPMSTDGFAPEPDRIAYAETRRFANLRSVIKDGWKLIRNEENGEVEMYNFIEDPDESKDWSEHDPERLAQMTTLLDAYTNAPQLEPSVIVLTEEMTEGLQNLGYVE
jgi:choline-sulfatase